MRQDVYQAIKLLIECDNTVSAEQGHRILAECRKERAARKRRLGTLKQATEILGCHPRTVARYVACGKLQVIRHSPRMHRYDLDEVEAFANGGMPPEEGET